MGEIIMNVNTLPEMIIRLFPGGKVRVREENGALTILPAQTDYEDDVCPLYGFLGGGRLSTEGFLEQKRLDKELEA